MSAIASMTGFEGWDIRSLIDQRASAGPDRTFMIWEPFVGDRRAWSFREFRSDIRRFAGYLIEKGVEPGDRILVHLTNSPESVIAWFGCAYAGAVAVTTNAGSSRDELAYFVKNSGAVGGVTQGKFATLVREAAPDLSWLLAAAADGVADPVVLDEVPFARAVEHTEIDEKERPHDPTAPFAIQYTSGTTSCPKAVLWSHANALWGARLSAIHEDLHADDVHLIHLPLFHTNAQVYSLLASLWAGGTVVIQPCFSASRFWEVSLRNGCTWTSVVPFCLKALSALPVPDHSYRFWGNAVCEPAADKLFGVRTIGWWGMTETITHGTVGCVHGQDATMSIGRPSPGYEILVLDEDGRPVSPGQTGDLFVRGRRGVSLFVEYAGDPEATAAAFTEDGLFRTGDRATLGADGFLYFADRTKDMLKVGGENVSASEVEYVIHTVPGVVEVAVVGRQHPMLDEVPVAFVIAEQEAPGLLADIEKACERLAQFKRPHELRLVPSLPRATLDKVAKAELRRILAKEQTLENSTQPNTPEAGAQGEVQI